MKKLQLAFSPCPNDTFMFDAMIHGKIDTEGLEFEVVLEDVETLNKKALAGESEISKLSFYAYTNVTENYQLLSSGSALGKGVGPLFISKRKFNDPENEIRSIAIPGKNTTAYFLFRTFFPKLTNVNEIVFSDIESAILDEKVDAGVIIHENRFTYETKGLLKIADLGEMWEQKTKLPIPLGGIVIRRDLDENTKKKVERILRKSVEYAFANPESSGEYVKLHAQEMSPEVRKKHIDLYVNSYSTDLGANGKNAIHEMFRIIGVSDKNIFV
ncbi:MAG: 1,4-dihydroxy-6-naphthoate synthase [Bacteroidetes bacterium]|nr:1,4-dihydroxy-6-naphthoate synthase [Bacteroidota bacterium]